MDSFNQWFLNPVKNQYFEFDGRTTRQKFWMFTLYSIIISIALEIIGSMVDTDALGNLYSLAILLPSLGFGARRLHDLGKSGWWQLLWFIPIIGWIILIVFLATQGQTGANEYGPDPRVEVNPVSPVPPAPAQVASETTTTTEATTNTGEVSPTN